MDRNNFIIMPTETIKVPSKGKCDKPQEVVIDYGSTTIIDENVEPVTSDNITF